MERDWRRKTAMTIILVMVATGLAACSTEIEKAEQKSDDTVVAKSDQAPPKQAKPAPLPGDGEVADAVTAPAAPAPVREVTVTGSRLKLSDAASSGIVGFAPPSAMRGPITERYAHFDSAGIRRASSTSCC